MRITDSVDTVLTVLRVYRDEVSEFADELESDPVGRRTDVCSSAKFATVALTKLVDDLQAQRDMYEQFDAELAELIGEPEHQGDPE